MPRRSNRSRAQPPRQRQPLQNVHRQFIKLQVLNTFSSDSTSPSICIHTQSKTYLFNCSEGMQRICTHRARIPRESYLFLTRVNWDVAGGLPGFILTSSEKGQAIVNVHGPKNLMHYIATFRNFIFRTNMKITAKEFDDNFVPFEDEILKITPIPISPSPSPAAGPPPFTPFRELFKSYRPTPTGTDAELRTYRESVVNEMFHSIHFYEDPDGDKPMSPEDRKRREEFVNQNLPPTTPCPTTLAYLVKNHDISGRFDVQKALALGVPEGRMFGSLKNGESVPVTKVVDGMEVVRMIRPEEVLEDSIPGAVVLVVDIPSVDYVANVIENEALNQEEVKHADIVVHMLSDDVVGDERYIKWMDSFKGSSKHLVMAPKLAPDNLTLPEQYCLDIGRYEIDKDIFPLPRSAGNFEDVGSRKKYVPARRLPSPFSNDRYITDVGSGSQFVKFYKELTYQTRNPALTGDERLMLTAAKGIRSDAEQALREVKVVIAAEMKRRSGSNSRRTDPEIVALGTGSSFPTNLRNVSGTLVKFDDQQSILLDCGEGTLATMKRVFSSDELTHLLRNLGLIYISHLHADHHLGTIGLLKEYIQVQELQPEESRKPIFIIAPFRLITSLYEYSQLEDMKLDEYLIPFNSFDLIPHYLRTATNSPNKLDQMLYEGLLNTLSLKSIETCFVPHCQAAYGVGITDKSGFKFVYSGDCRPSPELIALGQDATLLIHEATLSDHELDAALDKMHSTTSEAIDVGKRMNAENIFLTHFSQKYMRVPEFVLEWEKSKKEVEKFENVSIAFDRMRIRVGDLWKVRQMYPVFEKMYVENGGKKRRADEMEDGGENLDRAKGPFSLMETASG